MGLGGIGIWQLLIVLVIVLLLFGTKRLRGLGGDLGGAIKGFKKAMTGEEAKKEGDEEEDIIEAKKVVDETEESKAEETAKTHSETKQ